MIQGGHGERLEKAPSIQKHLSPLSKTKRNLLHPSSSRTISQLERLKSETLGPTQMFRFLRNILQHAAIPIKTRWDKN